MPRDTISRDARTLRATASVLLALAVTLPACASSVSATDASADASTVDASTIDAGPPPEMHLSAAGAYSCVLRPGGTVRCWGRYGAGPDVTPAPYEVAGLTGAREVTVSPDVQGSACALRSGGGVVCWSIRLRSTPEPVAELPAAVRVTGGAGHWCVLTAEGEVFCWGDNRFGELGRGSYSPREGPGRVVGLGAVRAVSAGEVETCAVTRAGQVWCWGRNYRGALGDGLASGHGCPVFMEDCSATPVRVAGLDAATGASVGLNGACAVQGGRAWCWGWNTSGRVGDGTETDRLTPVALVIPGEVASVYSGYLAGAAVGTGGSLWRWGYDQGDDDDAGASSRHLSPTPVDGIGRVLQASGGWGHLCALRDDGAVFCRGENGFGQRGVDGAVGPEPTRVPGL